jgi:hypothetical protein
MNRLYVQDNFDRLALLLLWTWKTPLETIRRAEFMADLDARGRVLLTKALLRLRPIKEHLDDVQPAIINPEYQVNEQ